MNQSEIRAAGGIQRPRVALWQDGARLHYALAVALKRAGLFSGLYTDWYNSNTGLDRLAIGAVGAIAPAEARRMGERQCPELLKGEVFDAKYSGALAKVLVRAVGWGSPLLRPIWAYQRGRIFAHGPLASPEPGRDALFAFSHCASARAIRQCHDLGIAVVLDQPCAPAGEISRQWEINGARWPGWAADGHGSAAVGWAKEENERLRLADHITCGSAYVREAMAADGIPAEKITVIPYPLETGQLPPAAREGRPGPTTVGFCGRVSLLKGAPWFLEVAKTCRAAVGDKIRFVMVGTVGLPEGALSQLREHVEVAGPVARSGVAAWLARFDILLFPSTNEGCPSAVMEAMATGLPIVTTPNSGTVVREGVDGFIAPYDQPELLAQRVLELANDAEKRRAMGQAAAERAREFSIGFYSREISRVIYKLLRRGPP